MARKFLVSLDLNKNELLNARIQNLSTNPSSPVAGQIYFNTTDNEIRYYDGTQWISGSSVEFGNTAARPAASKAGQLYVDTEAHVIYVDNGTAWVQGTVTPDDVAGWIEDHSDLTTGVHGVTGNVVGTSDTQTLSNKTISDSLHFQDGSNNYSAIYANADDLKIDGSDDIVLTTNSGDIILNPDGAAYVNSDEIVTRTATQDISNKRITDTLYFQDGSTAGNEGEIAVRAVNHDFDVQANLGDLNLNSTSGDVNLNPDGVTNVNSQLNVSSNLNVGTVAGSTELSADGSLTLQDGNADSQIHINGTTKNIELLPHTGSKAFYGSASTAGNEIARISDVQSLSSGLDWKAAVNVHIDSAAATAMGLDLSESDILNSSITAGNLVIDGHTIDNSDAGYRILVTGTMSPKDGIWVLQSVAQTNWTAARAEDADTFAELKGAAVFVMEGDQYAATSWVQNSHYLTDFDGQTWIQFSGQGTYIGSDSIEIDGREINAIVNATKGLAIDGDGIKTVIGNGIEFDIAGQIAINAGTGFDISSGSLEFASSYGVRKFTATVGNNSATSFNLDHNFDTRYVTVQIFEAASPYAQVEADVEHSTANRVVVKFASAPATNEYEIVIVG